MKKYLNCLALPALLFVWFTAAPIFQLRAQSKIPNPSGFTLKYVIPGSSNANTQRITESEIDVENPGEDYDIDVEVLKLLVFENIPTIYLTNSTIQDENENFPQRVITDVASIYLLQNVTERYRPVKIIQINIGQNQDKSGIRLNPDILSQFNNLTHIFIKSNIPLTKEEVSQMVTGYNDGDIILLYQVNSNF